MPTYRVFVKRTYIAVEWFDVVAETPIRAEGMARRAATKLHPDPRAEATDNGWLVDGTGLEIRELGAWERGKHAMREVAKDVFQPAPKPPDLLAVLNGLTHMGTTPDGRILIGPVGWRQAQEAIKEYEAYHQNVTTV